MKCRFVHYHLISLILYEFCRVNGMFRMYCFYFVVNESSGCYLSTSRKFCFLCLIHDIEFYYQTFQIYSFVKFFLITSTFSMLSPIRPPTRLLLCLSHLLFQISIDYKNNQPTVGIEPTPAVAHRSQSNDTTAVLRPAMECY